MDHVFISYAGKDRALAERLNTSLRKRGVLTRSALDIQAGSDWHAELVGALQQATAVIVVVTPRSLDSGWVAGEWSNALEQSLRVIPVLADGVRDVDLPTGRGGVRSISLDEGGFEAGVQKVVDVFASLRQSTAPRPSALVDVSSTADDAAGQELLGRGVEPMRDRSVVDEQPELVFVITSFRDDMTTIVEAVRAAAHRAGLLARRADDHLGDVRLHDAILSGIEEATLVVADLTHERPNVYFELGYARGRGKPVVTIARSGTELHFNVRDYRCLWYNSAAALEQALEGTFRYERTRRKRSLGRQGDVSA